MELIFTRISRKTMKSLADIIKEKLDEKQKIEKQERRFLNKQIDDIYHSSQEKILRKKENWRRYCAWCKLNKKAHTPENVKEFKKTARKKMQGKYLEEQKSLWFFTSHMKTQDLYFIISQMKDCLNRGKSASAYIISNTQVK